MGISTIAHAPGSLESQSRRDLNRGVVRVAALCGEVGCGVGCVRGLMLSAVVMLPKGRKFSREPPDLIYEYVQSLPIRSQAPTIPHTTPVLPNRPASTVM